MRKLPKFILAALILFSIAKIALEIRDANRRADALPKVQAMNEDQGEEYQKALQAPVPQTVINANRRLHEANRNEVVQLCKAVRTVNESKPLSSLSINDLRLMKACAAEGL